MSQQIQTEPSLSYLSWSLSSSVELTFQVLGDFRLSAFMPDHRCYLINNRPGTEPSEGYITLEDAVRNRNWVRFSGNPRVIQYELVADLIEDGWVVKK